MVIYYEVPYEAGFSSGTNTYTELNKALTFAKDFGYGQVYIVTKQLMYQDDNLTEEYKNLIKDTE